MDSPVVRFYVIFPYQYIHSKIKCYSSSTSLLSKEVQHFSHLSINVHIVLLYQFKHSKREHHGHDHMVVGFYNYLCNQFLSSLKLGVWTPLMARCTRYNIMWYTCSLSVTCGRLVIFSGVLWFIARMKLKTTILLKYCWKGC